MLLGVALARAATMRGEALTEQARWPRADLFFMKDALDHGISYAEVAGFLSRTEEEVREESERELNRTGARPVPNPRCSASR